MDRPGEPAAERGQAVGCARRSAYRWPVHVRGSGDGAAAGDTACSVLGTGTRGSSLVPAGLAGVTDRSPPSARRTSRRSGRGRAHDDGRRGDFTGGRVAGRRRAVNILKSGSITQEAARRCGQPLAQGVARVWRIDAAYQMLNTGSVDDEISQLAQLAQVAASAPALPVVRAGLARALFFLGRTEEAGAVYQTATVAARHRRRGHPHPERPDLHPGHDRRVRRHRDRAGHL